MTDKERIYFEKYGKELFGLKEACKIWIKPSYSQATKYYSKMGDVAVVKAKLLPQSKKVGNTRMYRLSDIIEFIEA
jgi:hypothetical protein